MIGYRAEQNTAYTPQTCTTVKETEYYLVMPTSQENIFRIGLPPVELNPSSRNKIKVKVGFPAQISYSFVSCEATETSSS